MEITKLILEFFKVLVWPIVLFVILAIYHDEIKSILNRLKKAELPGGITFEAFPQHIEEAKVISHDVKKEISMEQNKINKSKVHTLLPLTEANTRMINLGLSPSPSGLEMDYYKAISEQDPNLALAGLRMELEAMLKNLAKGFKISLGSRDSAGMISRKLRDQGAITINQYELINSIINLANAAIHGVRVNKNQANEILDLCEVLKEQYINWLSWGFPKRD